METKTCILLPSEVEAYLESLETFDIESIGTPRWIQQHKRVCKLSMQAVMNAVLKEEEIVKENLLLLNKTPLLIHELILTEMWKKKIFPEIVKMKITPSSHLPLYSVLFHEATLMTFLEAVMFHHDVIESASDLLLDFIDYCHRNLLCLISKTEKENNVGCDEEKLENKLMKDCLKFDNEMEELQKQVDSITFEVGIKTISILSYLSQYIKSIPLSAMHRMLNMHDVPLILVSLLEKEPWCCVSSNGEVKEYIDGKWQVQEDINKMTKTEGLIWMSLFCLLLDSECQKKYQFNGYRKSQVIRLKSKINEVTIDQLPMLHEMLRFLEHLEIFDPPAAKADLIIEQTSEIWDLLIKEYQNKWIAIAEHQSKHLFSPTEEQLENILKELSIAYDMNDLEAVLPYTTKCAVCGVKAGKRCSRCKNEWYCRRECQVAHWEKHKVSCLHALEKIKE